MPDVERPDNHGHGFTHGIVLNSYNPGEACGSASSRTRPTKYLRCTGGASRVVFCLVVPGARIKANREGLRVTVAERSLLATPATIADMPRRPKMDNRIPVVVDDSSCSIRPWSNVPENASGLRSTLKRKPERGLGGAPLPLELPNNGGPQ